MPNITNSWEADAFFASLPDSIDKPEALAAAMPATSGWLRYLPVAGTAGKTAVASLTAEILRAAGFSTGLYTVGAAPLSVRLTINGGPATSAAYAEAADGILEGTLLSRPAAELAAACCCFEEAGCDFAVVELVDGALAAALPDVPVCAVTHIGPDGTGRSVEQLARAAAAVLRAGCTCVTAPGQPKAVISELVVAAANADCELVVPDPEDIGLSEGEDEAAARMNYGGYELPQGFVGEAAACNAATAVELALALWRRGKDIPDEAILAGLAAVRNRSSIRIYSRHPLVILDACRTPQQAAALLHVLRLARLEHLQAVVGMRSTEGAEAFFAALERGLETESEGGRERLPGMTDSLFDRVYIAAPIGTDPALARELEEKARFHFETDLCGSQAQAHEKDRGAGGAGVLVCGSEELAIEAERLLK